MNAKKVKEMIKKMETIFKVSSIFSLVVSGITFICYWMRILPKETFMLPWLFIIMSIVFYMVSFICQKIGRGMEL